ncbi:hypothetical protein EII17_01675 [Clostridiales bacterium COT073_COT-073]|nr:hypothetical protein EII17_01675 [Clostridiales bacterium COT073_COT-073]
MSSQDFQIISCTCNYQKNPMGIEEIPVFSWKMTSSVAGDYQTARRIIVTEGPAENADDSSPKVLWDTGIVKSQKNLSIEYEGINLKPRKRYYWQVIAWNSQNQMAMGEICWFETGKMGETWQGKWIGAPWPKLDKDDEAAIYFRKKFMVAKEIKSARLYICGLGLYEVWLENKRISDILLEPGYTKYDARALYRVYDVTEHLLELSSATLGVIVGNGWYNCFSKDVWNTAQATWRSVPKLICELHLEYADGQRECIYSGTDWHVSKGPITFNCIRSGEHYDARLEQEDWCKSSFEENKWQSAIFLRAPGGIIKAAQGQPIRAIKRLQPVRTYITSSGRLLVDFGQNIAGKGEITVDGPRGREFILRYAEKLTADGQQIDQSYLRCFLKEGEFQTDHYIKKSAETETWSSRFVYHGFRYVEIEAVNALPEEIKITAVVMHTDFAQTGLFECSEEGLNMIQHLCLWASYSNAMGLPTSDPHREKNAWTGDGYFAAQQFLLNFDGIHFFMQWLDGICDCQRPDGSIPCVSPSSGWGYNWGNGPDWSMALTALPWLLYLHTANKKILEKYYPYVRKHFEFMRSMAVNNIVHYGIGDWCAPFEGLAISVNMESFKAPTALTDTACYLEAADLLNKMSIVLKYENPYAEDKGIIRQAIRAQFVKKDLQVEGNCQTSDGCIIWNHILSQEEEKRVIKRLVQRIVDNNYHLDFGVLGQKYVMESLGDYGYVEVLFEMLCQRTYPGYLYMAENGCTTLTECWNLNGSRNHMMFSHVSAILYRYIAGICLCHEAVDMSRFELRPSLLTGTMECSYATPNGIVAVKWKTENEKVLLTVQIPFGTTAVLSAPSITEESGKRWNLGSGISCFEWKLCKKDGS